MRMCICPSVGSGNNRQGMYLERKRLGRHGWMWNVEGREDEGNKRGSQHQARNIYDLG
ncbi:hypothetical protein BC939DRAFT_443459 [Gamsiella multidivaricata]|uniref:uncharacterized protein n=1 Tax=Gamsiella multidivaricata TaxID=101098 RepID=UPI002220B2AE|nr:uncharacterized protein BC939DRAFT_443459 [Gamsiella multidivaricata]KAI7828639.1 hypothetical protein BC939DRAFT_443459 [Gamsiella multidivaricata]